MTATLVDSKFFLWQITYSLFFFLPWPWQWRRKIRRRLTKHFTFQEPQNPPMDEFSAAQKLRFWASLAVKCSVGRRERDKERHSSSFSPAQLNSEDVSIVVVPDRPFHIFRASKSVDRWALCSSKTWIDGLRGSKSVGLNLVAIRESCAWVRVARQPLFSVLLEMALTSHLLMI